MDERTFSNFENFSFINLFLKTKKATNKTPKELHRHFGHTSSPFNQISLRAQSRSSCQYEERLLALPDLPTLVFLGVKNHKYNTVYLHT